MATVGPNEEYNGRTAAMAEEMKSQTKVAFANRKYTNEEKRKMEEEELEQF